MDNLTHSIIATALGVSVLEKTPIAKYKGKIALLSAILVFIPDMDIVLRLVSSQLYALEHRGFTHSIVGGIVIVPLGAYISRYVFRKNGYLSCKMAMIYSLVIWLFGHIMPDVFTIYGVQLLYPFDHTHYDYAIMFIVDIGVVIFGLIYMLLYFKTKTNHIKYSKMFLIFMLSVYTLYTGIRIQSVATFKASYQSAINIKYSPVLLPYIAHNIFAKTANGYVQEFNSRLEVLPIIGKIEYKQYYPYMPLDYVQNALPNNGVYSVYSKYFFKRYQQFGHSVLCKPIAVGARCVSLKYKYPSVKLYERNTNILERTIPF